MTLKRRPGPVGLYDPRFERDSCGVGFIAQMKGIRSHSILQDARRVLENLQHRGASGAEKNTGDGAGILFALPWEFMEKEASILGIRLPERRAYGVGLVFLSSDKEERLQQKLRFESVVGELGQKVLGWREVPRDDSMIGPQAKACEPAMEQVFIGAREGLSQEAFERKLFVIRKLATRRIRDTKIDPHSYFYICSLSTRVLVYKGMLTPSQLFRYFPDLLDPSMQSHFAMVHSRFSTNTFPSWDRAHPFRYLCHNGEINTLQGNVNKIRGREASMASTLLGDDLNRILPVIEPDLSDSGTFDNVLELLYMAGRSLPEAMMMMIPEAWQNHPTMPQKKKEYYEFQSCIMEPWDGPASILFTDGQVIGAVLDRNGLRPSRYIVTEDERVILSSEVGVLDLDPAQIRARGRLQPGKMFLVDFQKGRIVEDEEIKEEICGKHPYGEWLRTHRITQEELPVRGEPHGFYPQTIIERLRLFGYTFEHVRLILKPMADTGKEPLGSMGNDTPLACLSDTPRIIYDYFKQLFAQVTNPPIDSIREEVVMSLESYIGPEKNLLEETPGHAARLKLSTPFLTNEQLNSLKHLDHKGWKALTVDITYPSEPGDERSLLQCLDRICREAEQAIHEGYSLLILSDRKAGKDRIPLSALMAVGAVHHYLVRIGRRTQIGILLETGEPREVHHFCMLVGYGADGINPYLAFEAMWKMQRDGNLPKTLTDEQIVANYIHALDKGMKKVFGKMGISTLESYKGSQIFEAVGLGKQVIDRCFTGTPSRIGGASFDVLAAEAKRRHSLAYPKRPIPMGLEYLNPGEYNWRAEQEKHMWDPESIAYLQMAVRYNRMDAYRMFQERQDARTKNQATLRGLLRFKPTRSIPLEEVEPVSNIVRRFVTGAMSYGSISKEAHETLAIAMNRLGGKSNTGEGGEDPERFKPLPNGDSKRSAIKQVASGRFGVTIEYLVNADELQIKMAQGAKPGEGGELPGHKVVGEIAKTRLTTPGVMLISPPPHHDIYSIEDLAQLIFDLKNSNPQARISVKLVSEIGVGTIAAGVAKAHADHILISGHDGGTGASPLTGIKHAGLPWELGLAETHQTLVMNDLRSRVVLQTDGQLKTARDVVIAALLGAEEFGFATGALISMGCVMMRKCEKNTCPVGIATQDPRLRAKFAGKPEHVIRFFTFLAEDIRSLMAQLGFARFNDMIGRVDLLEVDDRVLGWKSKYIDLSKLLTPAQKYNPETKVYCCKRQDHGIEWVLDQKILSRAQRAVLDGEQVQIHQEVQNTHRAVGTLLSHHIAKRWGNRGLPDGTIHIKTYGSAGQSFGAFLAKGVTLELEGEANDYVGKGLSGGRIIVYPPRNARFIPERNILIGNVALYGATSGEAFFRGLAAERFCVRNSGAFAVVEGVGDHGCEYMTGGRVVILGPTGRNFAAGMSGGIAYVWDRDGNFLQNLNKEMVEVVPLETDEDERIILDLINKHLHFTGSTVAQWVLNHWKEERNTFHKIISPEYRKALELSKDRELEAIHG
ncbi:MAG: glutamate synthase large subunit [Spirochaetes bacterium]|nr:glutamate synthase large subunit [Spirochaetota bacterium]